MYRLHSCEDDCHSTPNLPSSLLHRHSEHGQSKVVPSTYKLYRTSGIDYEKFVVYKECDIGTIIIDELLYIVQLCVELSTLARYFFKHSNYFPLYE